MRIIHIIAISIALFAGAVGPAAAMHSCGVMIEPHEGDFCRKQDGRVCVLLRFSIDDEGVDVVCYKDRATAAYAVKHKLHLKAARAARYGKRRRARKSRRRHRVRRTRHHRRSRRSRHPRRRRE